MSDEGEKSPQQVIDALLVSAEQVQQEMDVITDKPHRVPQRESLPAAAASVV